MCPLAPLDSLTRRVKILYDNRDWLKIGQCFVRDSVSAAGWSANNIHNSVLLTKTDAYDVISSRH